MINQVRGVYQAKHPRMRAYRNTVLDLLQDIREYQFVVIQREQNVIANALAVSASVFKIPIHPNKKYEIQMKHRPTVPDNLKYWQVFEDGKQGERFLTTSGEFENCFIDEGKLNMEETMNQSLNQIAKKVIIQLSTNSIPKGLVPLEELFDNNDVAKSLGVNPNNEELQDVNIGTKQDPKVVKVASKLPQEIKEKYIQLLQKNADVFAWSYEDLKVYDIDVSRHTIPLKL